MEAALTWKLSYDSSNNPVNMFDPDGRVTMAAITEAMWANTPENSNSYWFNNGSGFTSYDGGDNGGKAGGGSLAYGSTVSYGSIFTMGDGIYTLPPLVLNGYGSSKNWGVTVNNYNNNHNILYNGIAGMQSAWNYANRPFDPLGAIKADGPIQFIGGTGDPLGLFDIAGQIISNWEPENRYLAMGAGVIGGIALKKPGLIARTESNLWKVGVYKEIKGTEVGLHAHHVGQGAIMKRLVEGYNYNNAPAILVPEVGHIIKGPFGRVSTNTAGFTNARQVLARDIFELRRVYGPQGIPNSALQELIQMNKTMYPGAFIK